MTSFSEMIDGMICHHILSNFYCNRSLLLFDPIWFFVVFEKVRLGVNTYLTRSLFSYLHCVKEDFSTMHCTVGRKNVKSPRIEYFVDI